MYKWECNHKGQTESFFILLLSVKYMLLDLNFINFNNKGLRVCIQGLVCTSACSMSVGFVSFIL